jgi:photoactive yellow protein
MTASFDAPSLGPLLDALSDVELDNLQFGVIGFDAETLVKRYNAFESMAAGLSPSRVLEHPLFATVAQCMNNYLVAQRFEDAASQGTVLDHTLDYVLTLRMRPTPARLRLLASPQQRWRYVAIERQA